MGGDFSRSFFRGLRVRLEGLFSGVRSVTLAYHISNNNIVQLLIQQFRQHKKSLNGKMNNFIIQKPIKHQVTFSSKTLYCYKQKGHCAGLNLGEGYRGVHPRRDDLRLSNTTGILQNTEICVICVLSNYVFA